MDGVSSPTSTGRWASTLPFFLRPLVVSGGDDHRHRGEEFAFSERLWRCGFRIVVDTTVRLPHIGLYG